MRLLIVEDDMEVAETLAAYLRRNGYVVDLADSLEMAREALATNAFDLVVLDRMLPDGEGSVLIAEARQHKRPQRFMLLTALAGVDDTVAGLESGAVDYIAKPFEPRELLARIRNALRRIMPMAPEVRRYGPLSYDVEATGFFIDEEPFVLRRTEALVLAELMRRPGALVTRQTLEARVYGYDRMVNVNSLETQISRLRQKLAHASTELRIVVVRGTGYRLMLE
ncbi:response regulator transcription factor [Sphingomonas sp. CLY1604]|uniref:response regulator transcription factor n=1 Tax=Sphingomonas sp. CLY1604 TaxID=3457786 RepID=UPI003FD7F432